MRTTATFLVVGVLAGSVACKKSKPTADAGAPRQPAATSTSVASSALPSLIADAGTPPLAGAVGVDAHGYPTQYVDRAALRAMLLRREFAELTKVLEDFQREFEADNKREAWPHDAASTFASEETGMEPLFDAWVLASPDSFAPYLARGAYRVGVGTTASVSAMNDIDKALSLEPKLVAAHEQRIVIGRMTADDALTERGLEGALTACRSCFIVRETYLTHSTPRAGGSYEKMAKFAASSSTAGPRMKLLPGLIELDKADVLEREGKYDAEFEALERACALGEYWRFLGERGLFHARHRDKTKGLADLDRAVALHPGGPGLLVDRAFAFYGLRRFEEAGRDLRRALMIDPTNDEALAGLGPVIKGLLDEGERLGLSGQRADAIRILELAAELSPGNSGVGRRLSSVDADAGDAAH